MVSLLYELSIHFCLDSFFSVENDILTVEGSLGGFQVRDVTPEGNKHQCIISVGQDPIVERSQVNFIPVCVEVT